MSEEEGLGLDSFEMPDLDDAVEPQAVAGGQYKVRIISCRFGIKEEDGHEKKYMAPLLDIVDEPLAKPVSAFFYIPDKDWMDVKELNSAKLRVGYFCKCFGLSTKGGEFTEEVMVGHEGDAILGPPVDDGKGYGTKNKAKRFLS